LLEPTDYGFSKLAETYFKRMAASVYVSERAFRGTLRLWNLLRDLLTRAV
jgi:hypothetical protein